jgi:hypothetical protein
MQLLRMECRVLVQERPLPVSADDSLLPDDVALVAAPSFGGAAAPSFGGAAGPSFGGAAAPSFGGAAAPSFGKTLLWTAIEQRSMAEHLSSQFGCHFEEKAHENGVLSDIQGGESEAGVRFYVSPSHVVKAYMNVLKLKQVRHLAQGLHEAAATAFVCEKKKWNCEVFGVGSAGTGTAHICLLRTRLDSKPLNANDAADAFVDFMITTNVAHGDPHPGNVLAGQVLDCERSFLIDEKLRNEMVISIRSYAHNPQKRTELMNAMKSQGLDDTRHRFMRLAKNILDGSLDIYCLGMNSLFDTFENKN